MTRDYSQDGDPYGISEYTAQSAHDTNLSPRLEASIIEFAELESERSIETLRKMVDVRGNTLIAPRGIPTQKEADAIKGAL